MGYTKCIHHKDMLIEWFYRLKLKRESISSMTINDEVQESADIIKILDWYDDNLAEWRVRDEERKKADKEATGSNKSSKSKSRKLAGKQKL